MTVPVIHPRLTRMLGAFFPSQVRVQAKTATQDAYGQEQETWADVIATGGARSQLTGEEREAAGYTATDRVWHVALQGAYPQITTRHRAKVDGEIHDIDAVEIDQTANVTRLRVRQVTT
ncbi:MAG: head-tail adaptor protein [Actinomycetes bacterium]